MHSFRTVRMAVALAGVVSMVAVAGTASTGSAGSTAPPADPAGGPLLTADAVQPDPLAERTTLTVAMSGRIESYLPTLLAEARGEFEQENLDVELVFAPPTDQVQLLAAGQIDVSTQAIGLASFNAIASGVDMRFVFPLAGRSDEDLTGWWVRKEVIGDDGFQPSDLEGRTLISPSGATGLAPAFLIPALLDEDPDFDLDSVTQERMALADMPVALINGAIDAANLSLPYWVPVEEDGCCEYIDHYVDTPTTSVVFGSRLLEDREVGLAYLRAISRVIINDLQGDYKADPDVLAEIAEVLEVPEESIADLPEVSFDPSLALPTDEYLATQDYYRLLDGAMSYDENLTAEQVYDLTFIDEILGR